MTLNIQRTKKPARQRAFVVLEHVGQIYLAKLSFTFACSS